VLIQQAGMTYLGHSCHVFAGTDGVTCVFLLSESHISIHTWPEHNYAGGSVAQQESNSRLTSSHLSTFVAALEAAQHARSSEAAQSSCWHVFGEVDGAAAQLHWNFYGMSHPDCEHI
jgi:S-adenosylmethionine/arginine decarboxylase-like enzyme